MLQSRHISTHDCVTLEDTSGAHGLPFLTSLGHGWFVGAALGVTAWAFVTAWGFSAVPSVGKVVRLQVALGWAVRKGNRGEDGEDWCHGCGVGLESSPLVLALRYRNHLSALSLCFNLRQGYYVHSSWGIVSINNLIAILYPSCAEVRDDRLCKYLNGCVRSQVFCSPPILEKN